MCKFNFENKLENYAIVVVSLEITTSSGWLILEQNKISNRTNFLFKKITSIL